MVFIYVTVFNPQHHPDALTFSPRPVGTLKRSPVLRTRGSGFRLSYDMEGDKELCLEVGTVQARGW